MGLHWDHVTRDISFHIFVSNSFYVCFVSRIFAIYTIVAFYFFKIIDSLISIMDENVAKEHSKEHSGEFDKGSFVKYVTRFLDFFNPLPLYRNGFSTFYHVLRRTIKRGR